MRNRWQTDRDFWEDSQTSGFGFFDARNQRQEINNPNNVKVVYGSKRFALYFPVQ
jgi:CMP-2-keto-3-deoxyoctulosonic acid synthetase